jgi:hypothetical protein
VFSVLMALYCLMEEVEVQSAARQMIRLHGSRAHAHSLERADRMLALGDIAGFHKWNRVTDAIKDMLRKSQTPASP